MSDDTETILEVHLTMCISIPKAKGSGEMSDQRVRDWASLTVSENSREWLLDRIVDHEVWSEE